MPKFAPKNHRVRPRNSWLRFKVRDITHEGEPYVQIIGLRSDGQEFDVGVKISSEPDYASAKRRAYEVLDRFLVKRPVRVKKL